MKKILAVILSMVIWTPTRIVSAAPSFNPNEEQSLNEFLDWAKEYKGFNEKKSKGILAKSVAPDITRGRSLAKQRRKAMRKLMQEDPKRALEMSLSRNLRKNMPKEILDETETPISAKGQFQQAITTPESPDQKPEIYSNVVVGDRIYEAYTYGRRKGQRTKSAIPFHGVLLDGKVAVHENPVRVMDPDEIDEVESANSTCPVSKDNSTVNNDVAAVEVDGTVYYLCNSGHIAALEDDLIGEEALASAPEIASAAWTEGEKKILLMRVNFTDDLTTPISDTGATSLMNAVNDFFSKNSYGKTSVQPTITPVMTMPQTKANYKANNNYYQLLSDARIAAKAQGFDTANFNLDAVILVNVFGGWSGMAYVGSKGAWLQSTSAYVANHEFGHNYGLWHANRWKTTDGTITGAGSNAEYGNPFDTMGSAAGHFNSYGKNKLGWIPNSNIINVSASGTYQLVSHSHTTLMPGTYSLKFGPDALNRTYWVDFRQDNPSNFSKNGVDLHWGPWASSNKGSQFLDTTPGDNISTNGPLTIGRTFSDYSLGVHVTPIGKAGTTPESMNVVVKVGTFPSNRPPTLNLTASATDVPLATPIVFTASASDPDNDTPLAYSWTVRVKDAAAFSIFGTNTSSATYTWPSSTTPNYYDVKCVVSDMKGGTASATVTLNVGGTSTNTPPTVANAANATPNPTVNYKTTLSVLGADDNGEANLTYTWSATGPGAVTFGSNGTNTSKSTLATFTKSGGYTLTATIKDAGGLTTTTTVSVVVPNAPPVVNLTAPIDGTEMTEPATINIAATASDTDGSIARVEFYSGTTLLTSRPSSSTYVYEWKNVMGGTYTITAKAFDNQGDDTISNSARVYVRGDTVSPTIAITNPTNGATVSGNVDITANATDNLGVSRVEFYIDGSMTYRDTWAPFSYRWNTNLETNGSHTIYAKAYDSSNNSATSETITVTKVASSDSIDPTVYISSPISGATLSGTVSVNANAADNIEVVRVELYVGEVLMGSDIKEPYSIGLNTTLVPNGPHHLTAHAFDAAGNVGISPVVSVSVLNNTPPIVDAGEDQSAVLTIPLNLDGTVLPPAGVTSLITAWSKVSGPGIVTFENSTAIDTSVTFDLAGVYVLRLTATSGTLSAWDNTTITVSAAPPPPDTTPPTISDVRATNITANSATIEWKTNEPANSQVEYGLTVSYGNASALNSNFISTHSRVLSGLTAGTLYHYRVKSEDPADNMTTSGDFTFTTIATNNPPTIANAAKATPNPVVGTTTQLTVLGNDDGSEANLIYTWSTTGSPPAPVLFGSNGTNVSKNTIATFSSSGLYNLRVTIRDGGGLTVTSNVSVNVTIPPNNTPPYVSISSPFNGDIVTVPSIIVLSASAGDNNGTITKVEFFNGNQKIGEVFNEPFTLNWQISAIGTYQLTAKATDNQNASTVSSIVSISAIAGAATDPIQVNSGEIQILMVNNVVYPLRSIPVELDVRLSEEANVSIKVFNRRGELIDTIKNGSMNAGTHRIKWAGLDVSAGTYFLLLDIKGEHGKTTQKQKFVLVK